MLTWYQALYSSQKMIRRTPGSDISQWQTWSHPSSRIEGYLAELDYVLTAFISNLILVGKIYIREAIMSIQAG